MRLRLTLLVSTTTAAAVLAAQSPAVADRATFHDAANDVVNANTGNPITTADGIDVRAIRVTFTEQALRVRFHHKNLTPLSPRYTFLHRAMLDTQDRNRGPEWVMVWSQYDYDLYRVDTYFQAEHPRPRMNRDCGDAVSIDPSGNTQSIYLSNRCLPRAHHVRTTGTFWLQPRGRAPRLDHFLAYRTWTPWVSRR